MTNKEAISILSALATHYNAFSEESAAIGKGIEALEKAEQYKWIKVKVRPTKDDDAINKDDYPWFLDCTMPDDEEEILIVTKWKNGYSVEKDICYIDDGYSLDSGYSWVDDAVAWMPLPEYEEDEK